MANRGVLDAWQWELHAAREFFSKNPRDWRNQDFYLFLACFVWGLYGGCLTGKCLSFVRDLSFWPALRTPRQFSQKAQGTDHLLCTFWTAGLTARPPDIGSVWCILIFQVSNRTIGCILDGSGGCSENFVWNCLSPAWWLGQRLDVQLFSHEIYTASRLFFAHSAGLLKSYL